MAVCLRFPNERTGNYSVQIKGLSRKEILELLTIYAARWYKFEGFADWSDQELSKRSGLSISQSKLSHARLRRNQSHGMIPNCYA